jgi:hypothetical protein
MKWVFFLNLFSHEGFGKNSQSPKQFEDLSFASKLSLPNLRYKTPNNNNITQSI